MDSSWDVIKQQFDGLFESYGNDGDPNTLLQALQLANTYFNEHPDCLESGYKAAYCYWGAMIDELPFADSDAAKRILKTIHSKGYLDAAYLLGKIYGFEENWSDAFIWMKRSVVDDPGTKDVLELAKFYSEGKGVNPSFDNAETLFRRLIPKQDKNPDFLGAYADHLLRWGRPECIEWYKKQCENPIDLWDEAAGMEGIVNSCLKFNRLDDAKEYCNKLQTLLSRCEDEETRNFVNEAWINAKNSISLYEAECKAKSEGHEFSECLNNGVNALISKQAGLAKQYLTRALNIEPDERLASLLFSVASVMEYNRDMESEAVRQLVSLAGRAPGEMSAVSKSYPNMLPVCRSVGRVFAELAFHIFSLLSDTYRLMINNQATYTGTAFRNYSAVGYGNKIYYPSVHQMATSMYELGDNMVNSFGRIANEGAACVWTAGNVFMKAYKNHAGFFEKFGVSSTISEYESKIKTMQ